MYHKLVECYEWEGTRQFNREAFLMLKPTLDAWDGEKVVLDLGCGTGMMAEFLWEQGWEVHGVDLSPNMLALARAKAADRDQPDHFTVADLREFDLGRRFPLIVSFYDVLNHILSPADLKQVFERVAAHLDDGGQFIFDVTTFDTFVEMWDNVVDFIDLEDRTTIISSHFDHDLRFASSVVTGFVKRGELYEKHREEVYQYCFTDQEITIAAAGAGLLVEDKQPFNPFPNEGDEPLKDWWVLRK